MSAFFSLAALAEVAAMENVHRLVVGALFCQGACLFTVTPCTEHRWRKQRSRQKSAFLMSSMIFSQCIGVHETWFKSTSVYVRLRKCVLIITENVASQVFYFECIILWLNFYFSEKPERAKKRHSQIIKDEIWSQASDLALSLSSANCKVMSKAIHLCTFLFLL